jgi:hypothetical protein
VHNERDEEHAARQAHARAPELPYKGPDPGAAARTVVESASQLPSRARAALEGGLDKLHDAIGRNDFTTLGRGVSNPLEPLVRARSGAYARELMTNLTRSEHGPVSSTVMDSRLAGAGNMEGTYFGQNAPVPPQNLHPIIRTRLNRLLQETKGEGAHFSRPGAHAEVNALNQALKAREAATGRPVTEPELSDFLMSNRWLTGYGKGVNPA